MGLWHVVLGALGCVFELKWPLAKALAIPFFCYLLLDAVELLVSNLFVSILHLILSIFVQTVFAVTTHRMILMGPQAVPQWGMNKWTIRETLFATHAVVLGMLLAVPILVSQLLFTLTSFFEWLGAVRICGFIVAFWVVGRLSLVFPAIAVDNGMLFRTLGIPSFSLES